MTQLRVLGLIVALSSGLAAATAGPAATPPRCLATGTASEPTALSLLLLGSASLIAARAIGRGRPG